MSHNRVHWQDLIVTQIDCNCGTLGEFVDNASFDRCFPTFDDTGAIVSWEDHFLSIFGEEANENTPNCVVDWTGCKDAFLRNNSH